MTSPISGISGTTPISPPLKIDKADTSAAGTTDGSSFADQLASGMAKLEQSQATSNDLAVQAATGKLTDVHDYMIASTEAKITTDLTVAVRNKAVDAFNEIMRLQA